MKKLIHEIHRRSLWQVLSIYVVSAWVALKVVDVLVDNFGLPAWFPAFALALLVIGLPLVPATAFVQEGVGHREPIGEPAEQFAPAPAATAPNRLFTWRNVLLGGLGALALSGVVATGWLLFGPGQTTRGAEPAVAEAPASAMRSIAVLPFATRAAQGDEEAIIFSQGMHDDLLTQLAKIDSLTVISRTSVMRFAGTTQPMREIAGELGVATVLEGGVQRSGERVRVNVVANRRPNG